MTRKRKEMESGEWTEERARGGYIGDEAMTKATNEDWRMREVLPRDS